MKREDANYFYVGLFVLAMILLLAGALIQITGRGLDTESYFAHFHNITGIGRGSPVTFGGYQIGQVDDIVPQRLNGATEFRLELSVREGWELPVDSVARITAPGLLSEYQVDIVEGASPTLLTPGQTMNTETGTGIFSSVEALAEEIQELSATGIKPLLDSLKQQVDAVGGELETHIPSLSLDISKLLEHIDQNMMRLGELLDENNRDHVSNIVSNADEFSRRLTAMAGSFNESNEQLNELLRRSNGLLAENDSGVREVIDNLRGSAAVVSRDIDSIVHNLQATSRNLKEFTRQLRANPAVLLNGRPPRDEGIEAAGR